MPQTAIGSHGTAGAGRAVRLHRMLYRHGAGDGRAVFIPYDHGLEHGPRDFADHPQAADPSYVLRLAVDAGANGVVLHIGAAQQFFWEYAGEVPLILKINGKTEIPPDDRAFSPATATVEEAVRLGADAVGYTLYVGSPRQDEDLAQLGRVREDAQRFGMPLIVWSYPRGSAVAARGGRESFYAIDYAARAAAELGADFVKLNWPQARWRDETPQPYREPRSDSEMLAALVRSAGRALVLVSGGAKTGDDELLAKTALAAGAGATGMIVGRNLWQRERGEALSLMARLRESLATGAGRANP